MTLVLLNCIFKHSSSDTNTVSSHESQAMIPNSDSPATERVNESAPESASALSFSSSPSSSSSSSSSRSNAGSMSSLPVNRVNLQPVNNVYNYSFGN